MADEAPQPSNAIAISAAGTFSTGVFDEGAAEIVKHDPASQRLFVVNSDRATVDVLDTSDPTNLTRDFAIDATALGGAANSVDVQNGVVAVAIEAENPQDDGKVAFYSTDGNLLSSVTVGALPDMVTFTPDGSQVVVANEGEPNADYTTDPEGSVSVIDLSNGAENLSQDDVSQAGFGDFNSQKQSLQDRGVRIFGPSPGDGDETATVAQDLEPEFVSVAPGGSKAYVSLQENNALAQLNLETAEIDQILPLGTQDHSQSGNGLDASDEDGQINIQTLPVQGMRQPDAIETFAANGETFIATANEGDAREYEGDPGFVEETELEDLQQRDRLDLNKDGPPDAADEAPFSELNTDFKLGELDLSNAAGDTDGDGLIEQLHSFGSRSFSIFDSEGNLVFDSGDEFEQITAEALPADFNANNDENNSFDDSSDDKGPEPEAVTVGQVDGTPFAFVSLERVGGIVAYDISDPENPEFAQYINNRNFRQDNGAPIPVRQADGATNPAAGDLGPEGLTFISDEDSPNGTPLLATGNEVSGTTRTLTAEKPNFKLQLLHASDLEGGVDAIDNAPNFAAVVDKLEGRVDNTLTLSGGDNFIPGPFFNAALFADSHPLNNAANQTFGLPSDVDGDGQPEQYESLEGARGRIDAAIMNTVGFDASAVGNHEFDNSTDALAEIVRPEFGEGPGIADDTWTGTNFPYLSANLNFAGDSNLADVATDSPLQASEFTTGPAESRSGEVTPRLAPATTFERGGERIGVVGATTPLVEQISSPGSTEVNGPSSNDMAALADVLQPTIDSLTEQGINKIVLTSHLQQLSLERELIGQLSGVDIVLAGGSDTILADESDTLRSGDSAADTYPITTQNADGDPAAIVSTAGEYSYVGRLVAEFDDNGVLIPESIDPQVSGTFATTEQTVNNLYSDSNPFAEGTKGSQVRELANSVDEVVQNQDGKTFGQSEVFLEGRREAVRTEETNLGNLTADANLAVAQQVDESVRVSLKNGGGIRAPIGQVGNDGELLPPQANPEAGKETGQISQLDITNSLRFNNELTLLTLEPEQLLQVLNHGIAQSDGQNTPGQFPQVGGLAFSFTPDDPDTEPNEAAVESAALLGDGGNPQRAIIRNGEVVDSAPDSIRIVTLGFLAEGGDGYPFPSFVEEDAEFANRVNLASDDSVDLSTGKAEFAPTGTEQDALAEFLTQELPSDNGSTYSQAETPPAQDTRIQNWAAREGTVLQGGFTLDIDGNGEADGLTDGILALRHLFEFDATKLTSGAVGQGASRGEAAQVTSFLNEAGDALDVDGNGSTEPLTDGILLTRFLFGFEGQTLTQGAVGEGATRSSPEAVASHLEQFRPTGSSALQAQDLSGQIPELAAQPSSSQLTQSPQATVDSPIAATSLQPEQTSTEIA